MTDIKGDRLYANLSASQARKRLKGFGHGVRKVHSAGRNQAVIIHTATGQHLEELEAKFADVGWSNHEEKLSEPIDNLRAGFSAEPQSPRPRRGVRNEASRED